MELFIAVLAISPVIHILLAINKYIALYTYLVAITVLLLGLIAYRYALENYFVRTLLTCTDVAKRQASKKI